MHATERERPNVKENREACPGQFTEVTARDLVFPDEFGANTRAATTRT